MAVFFFPILGPLILSLLFAQIRIEQRVVEGTRVVLFVVLVGGLNELAAGVSHPDVRKKSAIRLRKHMGKLFFPELLVVLRAQTWQSVTNNVWEWSSIVKFTRSTSLGAPGTQVN